MSMKRLTRYRADKSSKMLSISSIKNRLFVPIGCHSQPSGPDAALRPVRHGGLPRQN